LFCAARLWYNIRATEESSMQSNPIQLFDA